MPSTSASEVPCFNARSLERWMVGPSAIGSEKGTPSSMMSAPPETSASMMGTVAAGLGSPAVTKGISAFLFCAWSLLNACAMRDMSELHPGAFGDGVHVLVAAAGEVDQQHLVLAQGRGDLHRV